MGVMYGGTIRGSVWRCCAGVIDGVDWMGDCLGFLFGIDMWGTV